MIDLKAHSVKEIKEWLYHGSDDVSSLLKAMQEDSRISVQKEAARYMKHLVAMEKERQRLDLMYVMETTYYNDDIYHIAGVDEAGRGPAAGPVMVAAVILPPFWDCPGLNDSKKVSPKKRDELYDKIMNEAIAVSCIAKSETEIDALDIYHATQQGMYDAVKSLTVSAEAVLVDAMPLPALSIPHQSVIKGDSRSASIAAASIIAKVTRDRLMIELDKEYPQYGFAIHKGYLTQMHRDALEQYGPCPIHRRSFEPIKSMVKHL